MNYNHNYDTYNACNARNAINLPIVLRPIVLRQMPVKFEQQNALFSIIVDPRSRCCCSSKFGIGLTNSVFDTVVASDYAKINRNYDLGISKVTFLR